MFEAPNKRASSRFSNHFGPDPPLQHPARGVLRVEIYPPRGLHSDAFLPAQDSARVRPSPRRDASSRDGHAETVVIDYLPESAIRYSGSDAIVAVDVIRATTTAVTGTG